MAAPAAAYSEIRLLRSYDFGLASKAGAGPAAEVLDPASGCSVASTKLRGAAAADVRSWNQSQPWERLAGGRRRLSPAVRIRDPHRRNTGYASVGNFGSRDRFDYTAIGREVNMVARLQVRREPGKVLLRHSPWVLVRDQIPSRAKGRAGSFSVARLSKFP